MGANERIDWTARASGLAPDGRAALEHELGR